MKKTTKKVPKEEKKEFSASLKICGETCTSSGTSVQETLTILHPKLARGKGILTVTHGDKKVEKILQPLIVTRLFSASGLTRQIALKNVSLMFHGL